MENADFPQFFSDFSIKFVDVFQLCGIFFYFQLFTKKYKNSLLHSHHFFQFLSIDLKVIRVKIYQNYMRNMQCAYKLHFPLNIKVNWYHFWQCLKSIYSILTDVISILSKYELDKCTLVRMLLKAHAWHSQNLLIVRDNTIAFTNSQLFIGTWKQSINLTFLLKIQPNDKTIMAMKTCQTSQKIFESIGISANRVSFGLIESIHTLGFILYIMFLFIFIIHGAETTEQQTKSMPLIPGTILVLAFYLTLKFNAQTIFHIFDDIEQTINGSELKLKNIFIYLKMYLKIPKILILGLKHPKSIAMYEKTNQFVEKTSKVIILFFVKLTIPLIIIPITMQSFFVYFTTDSPSTDAFELPIPMW